MSTNKQKTRNSSAAKAGSGMENQSIEWVPANKRHGRVWQQGPLWFLSNFQFFTIALGFVGPSMGLSLEWTILASVLGILTGTVFMAFHASQGPVLGVPQMVQSRAQLGYRGVVVALFASFVTYLAFNIAAALLLGMGLNGLFGWPITPVAIGASVLAAILAIAGHDYLHKMFRLLLWISLPFYLIISFGILTGQAGGASTPASTEFTLVAFFAQFAICAAYNISFAPYVSDYSRYLPESAAGKPIIWWVYAGASSSAIWLTLVGAWLATSLGIADGLVGLQIAGDNIFGSLGTITAVLSAVALIAVMGLNAYSGMLTITTGIDSVRSFRPGRIGRAGIVVAFAIVWILIALTLPADGVGAVFLSLTLMLYFLCPWTALNLIDFFFVRKGHYSIKDLFTPAGIYGNWNARGLISYGVGFLAEIPFMVLPGYFIGPAAEALGGIDFSWVIGLLVAGIAYFALTRNLDLKAESAAIKASEAALAAE